MSPPQVRTGWRGSTEGRRGDSKNWTAWHNSCWPLSLLMKFRWIIETSVDVLFKMFLPRITHSTGTAPLWNFLLLPPDCCGLGEKSIIQLRTWEADVILGRCGFGSRPKFSEFLSDIEWFHRRNSMDKLNSHLPSSADRLWHTFINDNWAAWLSKQLLVTLYLAWVDCQRLPWWRPSRAPWLGRRELCVDWFTVDPDLKLCWGLYTWSYSCMWTKHEASKSTGTTSVLQRTRSVFYCGAWVRTCL